MEYKKMKDTIYLRIDKGEMVIETIHNVCMKEGIRAGYFQGIGACDMAEMSMWIPDKNDFEIHSAEGMLEMISLMGNISEDSAQEPFLHSHAVFSFLDETGNITVTAGHLKDARISYTGEIIIRTADEKIGRMIDHKTGIDVWKLS